MRAEYGPAKRVDANIIGPTAAFGDVRVAEPTPLVQIDAVYGIRPEHEVFSAGTGTVTVEDANFVCRTGAGVGGYGVLRSRRGVRYHPGQGNVYRFTAMFDVANAAALSLQAAGPFNTTNGYFVGFDGTQLGVMHRTDGAHEIRTLTLSAGASGAETLDLELNGVTYSIPVTAGTTAKNANEVETWMAANQSVWDAYQNGATVVLFGRNAEALSGAYSVSNGGGGETVAGSIAQNAAGAANVETWQYRADWEDRLDGSGPSGLDIDFSKGNVYEVELQYLGYGNVSFAIEDPRTGAPVQFAAFRFANSRTTPTLQNPTLKPGWVAASLGSTTPLTVRGSSAFAAIEGRKVPMRPPRGFFNERSINGATLTCIFALRVRGVINNAVQLSEALPKVAYGSGDNNRAIEIAVLRNPTFSDTTNWQYIDEANSIIEYDTTGTSFSDEGDRIASFVVNNKNTESFDFGRLAGSDVISLLLERGDVLAMAARVLSGGSPDVAVSLTWGED